MDPADALDGRLCLFTGVSFACAVHALVLFVRDRDELDALYGPLTIEGQIDVETQGTLPPTMGDKVGEKLP